MITTLGTHATTGPTWGIGYQRTTDRAFFSAFQRRRSAFGSAGVGGVYVVPNASTCASCTPVAVNFGSIVGASVGTDTHTIGSEDFTTRPSLTPATNIAVDAGGYTNSTAVDPANPYSQVGKIGWGDIDVSEDQTRLYGVSLNDRSLYAIDITAAAPGSFTAVDLNGAAAGNGVLVPDPGCANGVARPFAIGMNSGRVYVGGVCTAENAGGTSANLSAYVYSFDPATNTFSATPELTLPLNYARGCADAPTGTAYINGATCPNTPLYGSGQTLTGGEGTWQPWIDKIPVPPHTGAAGTGWPNGYRTGGNMMHSQPILSDIDFVSPTGDMVLGFRDRFADQLGNEDLGPENSVRRNADGVTNAGSPVFSDGFYTAFPAGDVLRAARSGSTWALESNGAGTGFANTFTNTAVNPAGTYNAGA
ncbi:hypothetical protein HC761_02000 [bacterium]|nr:hypothetical protein [bacterium]